MPPGDGDVLVSAVVDSRVGRMGHPLAPLMPTTLTTMTMMMKGMP